MNKNELISDIAEHAGISKADAGRALDGMTAAVESALAKGDDVRLIGFGTFYVSQRLATTGRNPRTGEAIDIPASKQPKFRPGALLKKAVNG